MDIRTQLIKRNIVASFLLKGWSAVVVLLMVPLTLKMLGAYSNGVWLTISSLMMWIDIFDIGLGNGLRNAISEFKARDEVAHARKAISSVMAMLAVIVAIAMLGVATLINFTDIYMLLGVDQERIDNLHTVLIVASLLVGTTFVFKVIGNIYMGLQLPAVSNMLQVAGQTLAFLSTLAAYSLGCRSLLAVVAINTLSPLVVWIMAYPYTFRHRYPNLSPSLACVDLAMARSMTAKGVGFFVLQMCGTVLFMSTNVIISHVFSPAEVTPYQIVYRYFSIVLILFTIVGMPFWNATTDAYTRGDIDWICNASHNMNRMMIVVALLLVAMTLVSPYIYEAWVGDEVYIPMSMSAAMASYIMVVILSQRYSYFLNGIGALRIQIIFTVPATLLFVPLTLVMCSMWHDVSSIVIVMCAVNLPGLVANCWKFNRIISTANG